MYVGALYLRFFFFFDLNVLMFDRMKSIQTTKFVHVLKVLKVQTNIIVFHFHAFYRFTRTLHGARALFVYFTRVESNRLVNRGRWTAFCFVYFFCFVLFLISWRPSENIIHWVLQAFAFFFLFVFRLNVLSVSVIFA